MAGSGRVMGIVCYAGGDALVKWFNRRHVCCGIRLHCLSLIGLVILYNYDHDKKLVVSRKASMYL